MDIDKEITLEIAKNKADEFVIKKELDLAKQQFINDLKNGLGEEIKTNFKDLNKPIKLKKPFRLKVKEFFKRISRVLGN